MQQFDIVENSASGDCLFHSLLEFLHSNSSQFTDLPHNVNDLRSRVVEHITKSDGDGHFTNFERFKDNLAENLQNEVVELSMAGVENEAMRKGYSVYMATPGNFGTTSELCAAAELYGFRFNIVNRKSHTEFSCYDYGSSGDAAATQPAPTVHLLFTGSAASGHFRLMIHTGGTGSSIIPHGKYNLVPDFTSSRMTSITLAPSIVINPSPASHGQTVGSPGNSETKYFECDFCGRPFDTQRGLNVHRNHHLSQPAPNNNPSDKDPHAIDDCFEDFVLLLARCKSNVKVLKRVPRGARISAANKLSTCIEECLANPFLTKNWKNLLTFAYTSLKVPDKIKNTSLATLVKRNVEKAELTIPKRSTKKRIPISLSKRVEYKIAEGNVKGAVKLLASSDTLAPYSLETYQQLQLKHPPPSRELKFPDPPDKEVTPLVVSGRDVFFSIKSFPNGTGSGIDGLLPQHLKDLTLPSTGEAGVRLMKAITAMSNYMLSGKVQSRFIETMYGAALCALEKKTGGIRPIAVGNVFRRITSKLASASVRSEMASKFAPRQVGFGIRGGCEAAAHATRTFIKRNTHRRVLVVKIDFRNAFNELDRDIFLNEMKLQCPAIYPYLRQCYAAPTLLFYGEYILMSQNGAQQGDPCGPLVFSAAIQSVINALVSEFIVFYLDDGTIAGTYESVLADFKTVIDQCSKIGLHINPDKCELYFCSEVDQQVVEQFNEHSPGICIVNEFTLLGAPISDNAIGSVFTKKLSELKLLFERLLELENYHIAFFILKNCFAMPKLIFLLRSTPTWNHNDLINELDGAIRSTLESITNTKLDPNTWILSSLPVNSGGLGVRKVLDTALPAFLSSVNSVSQLVSTMLHQPTLHIEEIVDYGDGLKEWNSLHPEQIHPEVPSLQRHWSNIVTAQLKSKLIFVQDVDKARFLAIQTPESGAWLQALPSHSIGTLLDNNTFRIAVGLRLGTDICVPHVCRCGSQVDSKGHHGLKCRCSAGRHETHAALNNIVKRALVSADIPAKLEPVGLAREDGKRVDGISLIPWSKGSMLIWDATCTDTLAPSNLRSSSKKAGRAADDKARSKELKYRSLINQNYYFVPFAVETMGPWCADALHFFDILSRKIALKTNEPRSKSFLKQRISMAIQRGNAASVMGTFRDCDKMNEIFYLL